MKIPSYLKDQIAEGKVILFLGAGAAKGAKNGGGTEPPTGDQLANLISNKFIGKNIDSSLQVVSELAVVNSDLITVQEFIKNIFEPFEPADFHCLVPKFRWHGIATTNYDKIIEKAYDRASDKLQNLVPILSNFDRVDDLLQGNSPVPYLKLHGCISRTHDTKIPLILTTDQYVTYRSGRSRLFSMLEEWGYEHPIVFAGQGLQDPDLRKILLELDHNLGAARPMYYLIKTSATDEEITFWGSRRITVLSGSFKEFLETLNNEIPLHIRKLQSIKKVEHPIQSKFKINDPLTPDLLRFLIQESDYVHTDLGNEAINPGAFYRGFNKDWAGIAAGLDVRREIMDRILLDIILTDDTDRPANTDLYVIKAEAGAGKTVMLHRLAWESSKEWTKACIFIKPYGRLSYDPIKELSRLVGDRIYLFVDNAADYVTEIESVVSRARRDRLKLTIITTERINEWNINCDAIDGLVNQTFTLPYLLKNEIVTLVELLEKHNSLGHLEKLSPQERINAFIQRAGRQLLVALHEATEGKPFEDILVDEYNEIKPMAAQSLYLTVCILNRLGVPVRAGLVSRIHDIPFTDFQTRLFRPLEHVVEVVPDSRINDYYYCARHPEIAEIVFNRILSSNDDRYREYIRILASLNVSYNSDRKAYRLLIKGKTLLSLFPDHQTVVEIFKVASNIDSNDPYLLHQKGIYEMNRPEGNLNEAHNFLTVALGKNEDDVSVLHSLAELARLRSENSAIKLDRIRYREEAVKRASAILNKAGGSYAYITILKVRLDQLKELLQETTPSEIEIQKIIQQIENLLDRSLQTYPNDSYLLDLESDFSRIIRDETRALQALERAFQADKRSPYLAIRLAKIYLNKSQNELAIKVLKEAVDANRADLRLHFALAKILITSQSEDYGEILYHLKRSFTPNDKNYEAQFWYGQYLFLSGGSESIVESKKVFRQLREARMPYQARISIRNIAEKDKKQIVYLGRVLRKEGDFGFIERDGVGDQIFFHIAHLKAGVFDNLDIAVRVRFNIGFNFGGPIALNIERL